MTFAFGHLIGAWVLGKIYEKVKSKKLSHLTWGFLLLGGILPDADLLLDWTLGTELHRTITHSLFFAVVVGLLVFFVAKYFTKENKNIGIAIGAGILMHLFLDYFSVYGVPLLWPYLKYFTPLGNYFNPINGGIMNQSLEQLQLTARLSVVDMAIGTAWVGYLWFRKRIQF
ncbi:metal-dependent hydrolase [Candidatus Woesearchaeota archaeon]|nr:metal-dependent hydrolase [Candidatus Woesearchaeota archaeon]